jgi:hypothetical protein
MPTPKRYCIHCHHRAPQTGCKCCTACIEAGFSRLYREARNDSQLDYRVTGPNWGRASVVTTRQLPAMLRFQAFEADDRLTRNGEVWRVEKGEMVRA